MAEGENVGNPLFFVALIEKPASLSLVKRESGGEVDLYGDDPIQNREARNKNTRRKMKHSNRSPLTGRFIAKRSTGAELVEQHNKATRKRRLWDLLNTVGTAALFGAVGFTLAIVLGGVK